MKKNKTTYSDDYCSGYSFPRKVLFDQKQMNQLFHNKWFFVGTRGDVPKKGDYLSFRLFNNSYFLINGSDGIIRCMVNRCAHQSARLITKDFGRCSTRIVCPNHQWSYSLDDGSLKNAPRMPKEFMYSEAGKKCGLNNIQIREVEGVLFASLGGGEQHEEDIVGIRKLLHPYIQEYALGKGGYKLAYHERVELDANWLVVMLNNRECCHCTVNHKGLLKLFSDSSFNGRPAHSAVKMLKQATPTLGEKGLVWGEQF